MLDRSPRYDQASEGLLSTSKPYSVVNARRGTASIDIPVVAGSARISLNGSADIERQFDFSTTIVPTSDNDLLLPTGTRLYVVGGWIHDDGGNATTAELPVLFVGDVCEVESQDGQTKVVAKDVAENAIAAGFEYPAITARGLNLGSAIASLLSPLNLPGPSTPDDFSTLTDVEMPQMVVGEGSSSNDRWRTAKEWASFDALQLRMTVFGQPWLSRPSGNLIPVYTFASGRNLGRVRRNWRKVPNVVIAHGGSSTVSPVRWTAEISDTSSPIHPSRVGRRVVHITSPVIVSVAQARQAAEAELSRVAGRGKVITFTGRANGALVPGDVVEVRDQGFPTAELVRLVSWALPLPPTGMVEYTVDTL